MASKDRARSAQITLSVPTAFHQIFRSNQQGVANPDQPDLGVIRVLPMTSATAEVGREPICSQWTIDFSCFLLVFSFLQLNWV